MKAHLMTLCFGLVTLSLALWGAPALAQPVEVLWSHGDCHLKPADSVTADGTSVTVGAPETWPRVRVGDVLKPGEQIAVMRASRIDLLSADDHVFTVTGPLRVTVNDEGLSGWPSHRRRALVLTDLSPSPGPVATAWQSRKEASPAPVHLVAPRATEVAPSAPRLRWEGPSDGRYDLLVQRLEDDGTLHTFERWQNLNGTEHALWHPLAPGTFYRWEVQLRGAPGVRAWSWFRVQEDSEREASERLLARLERRLRGWLRADDLVDEAVSMVIRARWFEALGRLEDAHRTWKTLLELHARDDVSAYVDRLRRRVVRPAGWLDEEDLPSGIQPMVP